MGGRRRKLLSLCTGIGGLDEGVIRAGLADDIGQMWDWDTNSWAIMFCHGYAHHGHSDQFKMADITKLQALPAGFDTVCGGLPCQPYSEYGNKQADQDSRDLFGWFTQALANTPTGDLPNVIVLENVRMLPFTAPHVVARLRDTLTDRGYDHGSVNITAARFGMPHKRERWVLVAWRGPIPWFDATILGREPNQGPLLHTPLTALNSTRDYPPDDYTTLGKQLNGKYADRWYPPIRYTNNGGYLQPTHWGAFTAPIAHWERIHGKHPATVGYNPPNSKSEFNTSAEFVEWMLGFDKGWITNTVPQWVSKPEAMRLFGNSASPDQMWGAIATILADATNRPRLF